MSRTLKRPMFRRGGPANDGIMSGLEDRKKFQDDPLKNFDVENVGKSARDYIEQFEPLLREFTPKTRLPLGQVGFALASGVDPIQALGAGYTQFTKADDAREAAIRKGAASMGISQAISQEQNRLKQILKDPRIDLEKKVDYIKKVKGFKTDEEALDFINTSVSDVSKLSFKTRLNQKLKSMPVENLTKAEYLEFLKPNIPIAKRAGSNQYMKALEDDFPRNPMKGKIYYDTGQGILYEFMGGDSKDINNYQNVTKKYNVENYDKFQ